MTVHQAQSKLNEVYDFLISFEGMINPDNIRFSRWLRDAQALRKSNPAEGFLMEALVYRAQGKLDKAVDYAKKSYQLDKSVARNDYATILSDAGQFKEAIDLSLLNLQEDNFDEPAFIRLIIDSSNTLNKEALLRGLSLFKNPNSKSRDLRHLGNNKLNRIDKQLSILEQMKITIDNFNAISSIAARALNGYYLGKSKIITTIQHNEVGTFLIIDEKIPNVSIDDCFMIHDKYIDDLIDSDLSFKDYNRIMYNFLPLEDDDLSSDDILRQQGILV
ncbi:tetratricopeptide repeat protein [uncultured Psychrobacter sp.]|uniref:tetratricopeptide repeat protein n=1 Tax=uncultured Psychrobacter sp. TaxID=259303 RepID=UPI003457E1B0